MNNALIQQCYANAPCCSSRFLLLILFLKSFVLEGRILNCFRFEVVYSSSSSPRNKNCFQLKALWNLQSDSFHSITLCSSHHHNFTRVKESQDWNERCSIVRRTSKPRSGILLVQRRTYFEIYKSHLSRYG